MSEPIHETPERPEGFPSQTAAAQNLGQRVTINPDLVGDSAVPQDQNVERDDAPDMGTPAVEPHGATVEDEDVWGEVPTEGWVVATQKGITIDTKLYGIGTVLDPAVVQANFTPWSMQKLVNAGVVHHASSSTPVPAGPWSVLGLRPAGTGEPPAQEDDADGEASEASDARRDAAAATAADASTAVQADPESAPPTVLNPHIVARNPVSESVGPVVAESVADADDVEVDPSRMSVAEVKRVAEAHPDLAADLLQAELAGRNRATLVSYLEELQEGDEAS